MFRSRRYGRFELAILLGMLAGLPATGQPLPKVELSKRGKEATALLELRPRTAYAASARAAAGGS